MRQWQRVCWSMRPEDRENSKGDVIRDYFNRLMGKRLKCLLMAAVVLLLPITAYASENDFFTITVPNSYEEEQKDNVFLYTKNDEIHNFTIAVSENSSDMGSIKKVTEENLETYEQSLLEEISGGGDNVIVLKRGLSTLSEYDAILFLVKRNDLNLYQSMYIFWSDHYLYNVCITADKEDFFYSEEYKSITNSFKIKDSISSVSHSALLYIILAIIAVTCAAVAVCLRYALKKDRKHRKSMVD